MGTSAITRSHLAELRAKEAGHNAVLRGDGSVSVLSDTTPGLHWVVRAFSGAEGDPVLFECRADNPSLALGRGHFPLTSEIPGCCKCQHMATAAARLEREGLIAWDGGVFVATAKAVRAVESDDDCFAGFPT